MQLSEKMGWKEHNHRVTIISLTNAYSYFVFQFGDLSIKNKNGVFSEHII